MNKKNVAPTREQFLFNEYLNDLKFIASNNPIKSEWDLEALKTKLTSTDIPLYMFRDLFRNGYKDQELDFSKKSDPFITYFSRCLGHKINEKVLLKSPRLSVLYSLCILKDRWRMAEDAIAADDAAAYLYSKYVICGRLPEKMHSEIVLKTFLRQSFVAQIYLREIEGLQRKKLCYN